MTARSECACSECAGAHSLRDDILDHSFSCDIPAAECKACARIADYLRARGVVSAHFSAERKAKAEQARAERLALIAIAAGSKQQSV